MATLIHDCPYCSAKGITFNSITAASDLHRSGGWNLFLICSGCSRGIVAHVHDQGRSRTPHSHSLDLRLKDASGAGVTIWDIEPKSKATDIPQHLPDAVAKAFKEGCEVLSLSADAAFGMFRKALEIGLKDLSPEVEAYKLHKRIDLMAEKGLLTASLKEWSHHLRLDANEMLHESGKSDKDHALEIQNFTKFVLMYLFTLPESVRLAQLKD